MNFFTNTLLILATSLAEEAAIITSAAAEDVTVEADFERGSGGSAGQCIIA